MGLRYLAICLLFVGLPLSQFRLVADELPVWTPIGPDGGTVQALAVSPALPNVVLAGVPLGHGIFRSPNRARNWQAATGAAGQSVFDLAISSNGRAFYAATNRGLSRSTDGGVRWPVLDASSSYTLVAAHPRKPAIVFAVQGGALLRSTNGGVTRTAVDGPEGVAEIAFAPAGQRTVVYAGGSNGLWRSTDDGRTWTDMSRSFALPPQVASVAVDPVDSRILYIGLQEGRRVLLKSRDGGATWRLSQSGLPVTAGLLPTISEIAVDRMDPSVVYAVGGGELFRSVNGGRTWSRPVPERPGGFVRALETTGYGVLAGTLEGVLLSVDRGLTWQTRNAGLAATSISGMTIDPQEPARLDVAALPGVVFTTAHQGRPWVRLGKITGQTLSAQLFATDPGTVYALASSGIFKSTDGSRSWTTPLSSFCLGFSRFAFDPREPDHLFASAFVRLHCSPDICTFFRSLDAGETWECLGNFLSLLYGDALLGVDPFTSAVYANLSGSLMRSTDDGTTWVFVGSLFGGVSSFTLSPLVEGTIWATQGRVVMRSRDGGTTWEFFPAGLPEGEDVVALAPDPVAPEILYAASRQNGVLKSTDAGETWSPAGYWPTGGVFLGNLLVDPNDPEILYAGTDGMGVLRLDQSGN